MGIVRLDPWPTTWNQLSDPALDGDATGPNNSGNNSYNDCGPESVSEAMMYIAGVNIDADYIKDAMYGAGYTGYTDFAHLAAFLNQHAGIPTGGPLVADAATVANHIRAWLAAGHPAIALFYFDAIHAPAMDGPESGGHFCPVIGYDDAGNMIISDPYPLDGATTGAMRYMTPEQWRHCSQGSAICLARRRSILTP